MNYNRLILGGRLTRDPDLKYTQSGKAVCNFAVAVNGFKEGDVTFIDCTAWEKTAETINKHLTKGDPILVEGEIKIDKWEGKDNTKKSKPVCNVNRFVFVGSPKHAAKGEPDEKRDDINIDF